MQAWWMDPIYAEKKPMVFPRRDGGPQTVIRMAPTEEEIKEAPRNERPAHHRVRVFVGR